MSGGKETACVHCGRMKPLVGRGMCSACYHRERRRTLRAGKEMKPVASLPGGFVVPVDFEPMAYLLEEIRKRAEMELRDVGRQVLWELNRSLEVRS